VDLPDKISQRISQRGGPAEDGKQTICVKEEVAAGWCPEISPQMKIHKGRNDLAVMHRGRLFWAV